VRLSSLHVVERRRDGRTEALVDDATLDAPLGRIAGDGEIEMCPHPKINSLKDNKDGQRKALSHVDYRNHWSIHVSHACALEQVLCRARTIDEYDQASEHRY
jgi:hypothetical protein